VPEDGIFFFKSKFQNLIQICLFHKYSCEDIHANCNFVPEDIKDGDCIFIATFNFIKLGPSSEVCESVRLCGYVYIYVYACTYIKMSMK